MHARVLTLLLLLLPSTSFFAQEAEKYYDKAMVNLEAEKYEEAIKNFDKCIDLDPSKPIPWFNRGITYMRLGDYQMAMKDMKEVLQISPESKKAWLNLGTCRKRLTDLKGALLCYRKALTIDPNYADAWYNLGLVYELKSMRDSACFGFEKAKKQGMASAEKKLEKCLDSTYLDGSTHSIIRLEKTAPDGKYGLTPEFPVKVGKGPQSGPANQRDYLELLRDAQGKSIKYQRVGSGWPYDSKNAIFGKAMVDNYEIEYLNEKGKKKKANIYISMYDYEEPMIPFGFKTVPVPE